VRVGVGCGVGVVWCREVGHCRYASNGVPPSGSASGVAGVGVWDVVGRAVEVSGVAFVGCR